MGPNTLISDIRFSDKRLELGQKSKVREQKLVPILAFHGISAEMFEQKAPIDLNRNSLFSMRPPCDFQIVQIWLNPKLSVSLSLWSYKCCFKWSSNDFNLQLQQCQKIVNPAPRPPPPFLKLSTKI